MKKIRFLVLLYVLVISLIVLPHKSVANPFWGEEEEKLGVVSDIYGNCYELVGVRTYYFWIQSGGVEMRWYSVDC